MFNLLPEIRADIAQKTEPIHTVWKPDAAHPTTGKISYTLQSQISRDFIIPQGKYAKNSLPQAEPNVRLSAKAEFGIGDPSPLSFQERGIADDAILSMQPILDQRPKYQKFVSKGGSVGPLSLQLINGLPLAMDLFVQKKLSLFNKTVESDEQYIWYLTPSTLLSIPRPYLIVYKSVCIWLLSCIDGDTNSKTAPFDRSEHLVFYFSTLRRATVTTTNRQMIRDFEFDSLFPIGMEIEMKNGRVRKTLLPF